MIYNYALEIPKIIEAYTFHKLEKMISVERRERIKKYRFDEDKKRSLLAEVLLRYALKKNFGISCSQVQFVTNSFGKPMLKNVEQIHFNLSHSGDWVVCGVSDAPIGIDVETIKIKDLIIAKRFFTEDEYKDILRQPEEEKIKYFFKLWTLKESYVKAEGKGLSIPLNSFSFRVLPHEIQMYEGKLLSNKYCFQVFSLDNLHTVAICSKQVYEAPISIISFENMVL